MLSGSYDKTVKLWDVTSGVPLRTFRGHSAFVNSVAFSPDGTRILSGSDDKTMKLWDAATGQLVRTFDGHSNSVESVAFSPDGHRVLSGSGDATMKVWDAATGAVLHTLEGHSSSVDSVAFSPDGLRIISGSRDTTVRIWDAVTGAQLATLIGGRDGQWLAMAPAGFFVGSRKGSGMLSVVRGLDVTSIEQIYQALYEPNLVREALALDPDREVEKAAKELRPL